MPTQVPVDGARSMSSVPRSSETHFGQARAGLERLIGELLHEEGPRLPPEDRLAEMLGFSRPTIRSALLSLQAEGKVHRVHGLGTFINRHAVRTEPPSGNLAEDRPFLDVITALGHEASIEILSLSIQRLAPAVLERLASSTVDAEGVAIERLFRASGRPAVYSRDLVPVSRIVVPHGSLDAARSTFAFLADAAGERVRYSVVRLRAEAATGRVADALGLVSGTPVLALDHLHIDTEDRPLAVTEAFLNQDIVPFSQVRTAGEL